MSIQTIAVVAGLAALPVMGQALADPQSAVRRSGAMIMADYDYDAAVTGCSLSLQGDQPVLAATIALPPEAAATGAGGGPHVKRGVDFAIAPAGGGGMPVVTAMAINTKGTGATSNGRLLLPAVQKHAINTKGTGTNNGRVAASTCDTRPSPAATLTGTMRIAKPTASCTVADDGASAAISVPLSMFGAADRPYTGHVTLMKRGADSVAAISGGAVAGIVVAACTSSKVDPKTMGWDLAVSKK